MTERPDEPSGPRRRTPSPTARAGSAGRPRAGGAGRTGGQAGRAAGAAGRTSPGRPRAEATDRSPDDRRGRRAGRDHPVPPPEADPALLDPEVRRELRGLTPATAERVARHLVAAGQLVDADPAAAYRHALAAKDSAARIGAVREAVGLTAYAAGDYAMALAELRAARRITGRPEHLPLIADSERGLGRPERALEVSRDPDVRRLERPDRVELAIVCAGARRDLGQPDAAVLALQGPDLDDDEVRPWSVRLWYAYADALAAAGRTEEAREWFAAAAAEDDDGETDAASRLLDLG